ncbi:MAG: HAD family hydrolase [Clostridia bacterium]|nr:HAD family hydrolase [Clostridia bacterium]
MLLFFDIDGTLIDLKTHLLPESALRSLRSAHEKGHLLFLNTGRTPCFVDERLYQLPFDGMVCGCGTYVTLHGHVLLERELSREQALEAVSVFRSFQLPCAYEGDRKISFDDALPVNEELCYIREDARRHGLEGNTSDADFTFTKFYAYARDPGVMKALEERLHGAFTCIGRGGKYGAWEGVPTGFSKATGMDLILKHTGFTLRDCIAFGDSNNDLPMLRHAGTSVCMGHAPEDVKEACTHVTGKVMEDGIELALKSLSLI